MKLTYPIVRFFVIAALALFVIAIVVDTIRGIKKSIDINSTRNTLIDHTPEDYLQLFNVQQQSLIKNQFTEINKMRYPVSHFDYDNNKYYIFITQINTEKDVSLNDLIKETYNTTTVSDGVGYFPVSQLRFDFHYLPENLKASNIYLNLNGDSLKVIAKNDTCASYYLKMKNFSIRYKEKGADDIFSKVTSDEVPATLLFIRRNKKLYFILMSVNYDDKLRSDLLNEIITSNK